MLRANDSDTDAVSPHTSRVMLSNMLFSLQSLKQLLYDVVYCTVVVLYCMYDMYFVRKYVVLSYLPSKVQRTFVRRYLSTKVSCYS
jgi:hypothetical protein